MSTKKLLQIFVLAVAFSTATTSFASSPMKPKNDYINIYSPLAIAEMQRTNIPASIIMAQAIVESSWGNGTLAREANNHFGIKCNNRWQGDCYAHLDDDYDKEGNLIESSFRLYNSVEASYTDHSDFLVNGTRYSTLFNYDVQDYVSWALGLKSAGYASDSLYAMKLIETIEKYELYRLDGRLGPIQGPMEEDESLIAVSVAPQKVATSKPITEPRNADELDEITPEQYKTSTVKEQSYPTATSSKSDTWESIINRMKTKARKTWDSLQSSTDAATEQETEILFERGLKEENMKPQPRIIFVEERQVR
jgi:hypothetical protein